MSNLEPLLNAFALRAYPFAQDELDPIQRCDDHKLMATVDGWNALAQVPDFLRGRAPDGAVMVVSGGSGTGRTSMCNVLIDRWRSIAQSDDATVVVVKYPAESSDANEEVWRWSHRIRRAVTAAGCTIESPATEALQTLRMKRPDGVAAVADALDLVRSQLAEQNAVIVGLIESISTQEFLSAGAEVAELSGTLILLTVDETISTAESVVKQAHTLGKRGKLLRLGTLSGHEAADVVVRRWNHYSETECPFSEEGLAAAFGQPQRSLKRILTMVDVILQNRFFNADGAGAPAPRIGRIPDDNLDTIVRALDKLRED